VAQELGLSGLGSQELHTRTSARRLINKRALQSPLQSPTPACTDLVKLEGVPLVVLLAEHLHLPLITQLHHGRVGAARKTSAIDPDGEW